MASRRPIVLVCCQSVTDLRERYPSLGYEANAGEAPLGMLYLAGELERHGFDVCVRDETVEDSCNDALTNEIVSMNPLLVGFSVNAFNTHNVRHVARLVRENCPGAAIVVGGPQVTQMPEEFAAFAFVDAVVTHQGEITLRKLAEAVRDGTFRPASDPAKKIIRGELAASLDDLALPARHLIDLSKYGRRAYIMDAYPADSLCSSRGCPHACLFCSCGTLCERKYRARSPKLVVDEVESLMKTCGSRGVFFREDNFSVDKRHVEGICREMIERGLDVKWECEARVDSLGKDTLSLMKQAGCAGIWSGVESGSQRVLDAVCKGITIEQIRRFYGWCREVGIHTKAYFMLGFPDEQAEDIRKTFDLATSIPATRVRFVAYDG